MRTSLWSVVCSSPDAWGLGWCPHLRVLTSAVANPVENETLSPQEVSVRGIRSWQWLFFVMSLDFFLPGCWSQPAAISLVVLMWSQEVSFGQVLSPLCCCCFKIQAFSFLLFVNLDCTKIPSRVILIHVEHPALNNILFNVIFPTKVCSMKYWKRLKLHLLLRPHQKFQECMNMQIWRCLQAQWRAASHPPIKCRWSDYT